MCYFWHCFEWGLDFIQRVITFCLACVLACSVCILLSIALVVGLAYGYNYSMVEFLTFKRSDVTVYLKQGKFQVDSEFEENSRRSGHEYDDDMKPIEKKWLHGKDIRRIITMFSSTKLNEKSTEQIIVSGMEPSTKYEIIPSRTPGRRLIQPHRVMTETTSQIIENNFKVFDFLNRPDDNIKIFRDDTQIDSYSNDFKKFRVKSEEESGASLPDIKLIFGDRPKSGYIPLHLWDTPTVSTRPDFIDEVDEDPRLYKPV